MGVGLVGHWANFNRELEGSIRRLQAIDGISQSLEGRRPLGDGKVEVAILGPDGKPAGGGGGGVGANFAASSIAPTTIAHPLNAAKTATGSSPSRIGSAGGGSDSTGGGINAVPTNLDKLAEIVTASGVTPPEKADWDRNGLGPGLIPRFIIETVLAMGTKSGKMFLTWCAGYLLYGPQSPENALSAKSGPRNVGPGSGATDRPSGFGDDNWRGGTTNRAAQTFERDLVGNLVNKSVIGPTSLSPAQGRALVENTAATVSATQALASSVKDLTAVVKRGQDPVNGRAGGFA